MSELETVFVRIEIDLSAFKQGMAEARREIQGFAKEAQSTFSGVGDALDLRRFRNELAASETAVKQSAERMKKAFGEVGKAQEIAARQCLERIILSPIAPSSRANGRSSSKAERPFDFTKDQEEIATRFGLGLGGAGAAASAAPFLAAALGLSTGGLALIILSAAALAAYSPEIIKGISGGDSNVRPTLDEQIEKLNTTIQGFLDQEGKSPQQARPGMGVSRDDRLKAARKQLAAAEAMRDAILEQQRQARETATQYQDFLSAFTELSDCLRELCTRLDTLAPLPSGGAVAPRPDQLGLDGAGAGAGGGIIPASFTGGSGFDLFNQELEAAGGLAGETGLRIAELAERAGGARAEFGSLAKVLRENNILFTDQVGMVGLLETLLPELGAAMTGAFTEASEAGRDLDRVTEVLGGTLVEAFKGAAFEGKSFRDVLLLIIKDILVISQSSLGGGGSSGGGGGFLGTLLNSAFGAIGGSLFGGGAAAPSVAPSLPFTIAVAKGGAFLRGDTMTTALAQGGVLHNSVVSRPTLFAMAKGYGLMGEAGPEAVMPLARLPNGELGVKGMAGSAAAAPAGPAVVYNIDARGADQQAIRELTLAVRQQRADLNFVNRTLERRAVNAVAERRRRGPFR